MAKMVTIKDRQFDLENAVPLTLGDWEDLEEKYNIRPETLGPDTPTKQRRQFFQFILAKVDPSVDDAFMRALTYDDLADLTKMVNAGEAQEPSRPSSDTSTPSEPPTDGAPTQSEG